VKNSWTAVSGHRPVTCRARMPLDHVAGRSAISADYEGVAHVLRLYGGLFDLSGGTGRVELHDVVANDEQAIALLTIRAERGRCSLTQTPRTRRLRGGAGR
jgi:hypothetical protein